MCNHTFKDMHTYVYKHVLNKVLSGLLCLCYVNSKAAQATNTASHLATCPTTTQHGWLAGWPIRFVPQLINNKIRATANQPEEFCNKQKCHILTERCHKLADKCF